MKLFCISDLHLEFFNSTNDLISVLEDKKLPKADVCILAGDIGYPNINGDNYRYKKQYMELLIYIKSKYPNVVLVAGNHEYYNSNRNFEEVETSLQEICEETKVHFLNRNSIVIDNVSFIGCTLWSIINSSVNLKDLEKVFIDRIDYNRSFVRDYNWLENKLTEDKYIKNKVIITHHLPSSRLIHKRFKYDPSITAFYTHIVDKLPLHGVKYWFCGHTHEQMTSKYGDTILYTNPLGYPGEKRETVLSLDTFEID